MAEFVDYWAFDRDRSITCPQCGWTGRGGDYLELNGSILDVTCPSCDKMIFIVTASPGSTRAAAAAGNVEAQAELAGLDAALSRVEVWKRERLREPSQLPDLSGDRLVIVWDYERSGDDEWQVLSHEGVEIWREQAWFENYDRFQEVFAILHERYGNRLAEVRPTDRSELNLYGDALSAPAIIEALNASL